MNWRGTTLLFISYYISIKQWLFDGIFNISFFDLTLKIGSIILMIFSIIYIRTKIRCKQTEEDLNILKMSEYIEEHTHKHDDEKENYTD